MFEVIALLVSAVSLTTALFLSATGNDKYLTVTKEFVPHVGGVDGGFVKPGVEQTLEALRLAVEELQLLTILQLTGRMDLELDLMEELLTRIDIAKV